MIMTMMIVYGLFPNTTEEFVHPYQKLPVNLSQILSIAVLGHSIFGYIAKTDQSPRNILEYVLGDPG
jgi:hypothetical protein